MTVNRFRTCVAASLWLLTTVTVPTAWANQPIDWQRAQELLRRERQGQTLTGQERAYLDRAKQQRRNQMQANQVPPARETTGLVPLTEMGDGLYQEQTGGLYGRGRNVPPEAHLKAAQVQTARIVPRDARGNPSPTGKIVVISLGMSNTTQEFSVFKKIADADPNKAPQVTIVDCAQGGQAARQWAYPQAGPGGRTPWDIMDQRIKAAGVAAPQVQVLWLKQAEIRPSQYGEFPAHARTLRDNIAVCLRQLKTRFPNLTLAYLSSRIYAGYAVTTLNPEPYAYESAFSVRWLIESQVANDPNLNYDPAKGEVKAPLLLWGPYLWADGTKARQGDGLIWNRDDLGPDGTHPSPAGRQKVADLLLKFFQTNVTTKSWFVKPKP
ncbi:MAG: hypothetical protein M1376_01865 [Planctomycetes bacterium]|nr:hypothetical protein [Planctomycetota bacterium]